MSADYGAKGCTCWPEPKASDPSDVYWAPNASCRHHGILADYQPDRMETGTYQVVQPYREVEVESLPPCGFDPGVDHGIPSEECRAGVCDCAGPESPRSGGCFCSVNSGVLCDYCESNLCEVDCPANPMDCPGPVAGECLAPTSKKETGVLAAVRRGWARFGDALKLPDRWY